MTDSTTGEDSLPVKKLLRELERTDSSQRSMANTIGCSTSYLSDVLNYRREPGPQILSYLGLEKQTRVSYFKTKRWRK